MVEPSKWCSGCKRELSRGDFRRDRSNVDGLEFQCNTCRRAYRRKLYQDPHRKAAATKRSQAYRATYGGQISRTRSALKSRYRMSLEDYRTMWDRQGGRCAICDTLFSEGSRKGMRAPVVDHIHGTHIVRGLLCKACNFLLGYAYEQEKTLLAAVGYLLAYKGDPRKVVVVRAEVDAP